MRLFSVILVLTHLNFLVLCSLFAMRVVFVTKRQDGDQLLLVLAQTFLVANLVLLLLSRGGSTSWEKS